MRFFFYALPIRKRNSTRIGFFILIELSLTIPLYLQAVSNRPIRHRLAINPTLLPKRRGKASTPTKVRPKFTNTNIILWNAMGSVTVRQIQYPSTFLCLRAITNIRPISAAAVAITAMPTSHPYRPMIYVSIRSLDQYGRSCSVPFIKWADTAFPIQRAWDNTSPITYDAYAPESSNRLRSLSSLYGFIQR